MYFASAIDNSLSSNNFKGSVGIVSLIYQVCFQIKIEQTGMSVLLKIYLHKPIVCKPMNDECENLSTLNPKSSRTDIPVCSIKSRIVIPVCSIRSRIVIPVCSKYLSFKFHLLKI